MPHQLFFVRPADWNLHFSDFDGVLERVNVLDALKREGYIRGYSVEELQGKRDQFRVRIELKYYEASGVTGHNVEHIFTDLVERIVDMIETEKK